MRWTKHHILACFYIIDLFLISVEKNKKELKLLFVNPCLRRGFHTKLPPVGLTSVMTYFHDNGYEFTFLDIDINEYDDFYVEQYLKNNHFDFILIGTIITHYKWIKWFVNTAKNYQPTSKVIVGNSVAGSIPELFLEKTMAEIKNGAGKLNEMLSLGLTEDRYIKTKGYQGSKSKKKLEPLDPEKIKRIENDVSFNYAQTEFKFEQQPNAES